MRFAHWGCPHLLAATARIRPSIHLFGHVHDEVGVLVQDGILFCNAALDVHRKPVVVDIVVPADPAPWSSKLQPDPSAALPGPATTSHGDASVHAVEESTSGLAHLLDAHARINRLPPPSTPCLLVHAASHRVLDVDRADASPGASVILWREITTSPRANQRWYLQPLPDGMAGSDADDVTVVIRSMMVPHFCLTVTETPPHRLVMQPVNLDLVPVLSRWSIRGSCHAPAGVQIRSVAGWLDGDAGSCGVSMAPGPFMWHIRPQSGVKPST